MNDAELLDDLSGFEFEDVMEDVFRKLGYENVRQAERRADEGRDVLMGEIAEEVGLDLYNARIEIVCEETLRPTDPTESVDAPIREAFRDVDNLDPAALPSLHSSVTFEPVVSITATVDATFETSVGVIHRVDETDRVVVHAARGRPRIASGAVRRFVEDNYRRSTALDEDAFAETFDDVEVRRFGQTETEYKEWAIDRVRDRHTRTVSYTGDNDVTYTRTCEPNQSDVSVRAVAPVYLPEIRQTIELGEYTCPYEYYAVGPRR